MDSFKIYIDRLRGGQHAHVEETVGSDFMQIDEKELQFKEPIKVQLEAYLAEEHMVVSIHAYALASMPCAICNEPTELVLKVRDKNLTFALDEIETAVLDLSDEVREHILLQVPLFVECTKGRCPERENLKNFFKQELPEDEEPTHCPFKNIL